MNNYRASELSNRILIYVFLLIAALFIGFPVFVLTSQSFMHSNEIIRWPPILIPNAPTIENYQTLFGRSDLQLPRWLFNSFFVSTAVTGLTLAVAAPAAYAFARLRFPGRQPLFFLFLITIMIPSQITLIPNFLLMRDLKFLDTYNGLIFPGIANVFGVFLLRQFFLGIPRELEEAAILDGASYWGLFWRVVLPLSTAALTALGIFVFLGTWNDLFWPLIVTNHLDMRTLPVGLTILNSDYGTLDRGLVLAAATFASLPVLLVYIIFQRRIIKGIAMTGMGGT